ncbi:MAG: flippase [Candidatus Auribacter fodinae]|jgi:O-antigen/teichoic acid export membrane protein|uniref:Flippase n=1 Tax=Candidatus Auribacter fodinae TaxID=2093366 RepID=A0A3A4QW04_9BACT|nr:MAG: flippase [Candidatus Auribacter fodinae]
MSDMSASDKRSLKRMLIKDSAFMYLSNMSVTASRFLLVIILARMTGPEQFGLLQLAITAVSFVALFLDCKADDALIRFLSEYYTTGNIAGARTLVRLGYCMNVVLGVLCFSVVFIGAALLAQHVFHDAQGIVLVRLYAAGFAATFFDRTALAALQSMKCFKLISLLTLASAFIKLVLPVVCIPYGLIGITIGYSAAHVLSALVTIAGASVVARRQYPHSGKGTPVMDELRKIYRFVIHSTISSTFKSVMSYVDVLILGFFGSATDVGYYKFALAFTSIFGLISSPVNNVIYPTLTRLWVQKDFVMYKKILVKLTKYKALFLIPSAAATVILTPFIIRLTVGQEFMPAKYAIYIIIWAVILVNIFSWVKSVLLSWEKPQVSAIGNFGIVCLMTALSYFFVPRWGYIGSSVTYAISYGAGIIFYLIVVIRLSRSALSPPTQ